MSRRALALALAVFVLVAVGVGAALALVDSGSSSASTRSGTPSTAAGAGTRLDRRVPSMPLLDAHGRRTSLAALQGKVVVLAPFLTLCHEVCPMTTGALIRIRHAVAAAGLADRVEIVEASVDPWRDTPARLRAYRRLTGVDVTLLTGTRRELSRLWSFFGVYFARQPQGRPPDVDWWTDTPETFDVAHSDGLFFLDAAGRERIAVVGMPSVGGKLARPLKKLLNSEGRENLAHPQAPWTVPQALADLGELLGTPIPA